MSENQRRGSGEWPDIPNVCLYTLADSYREWAKTYLKSEHDENRV